MFRLRLPTRILGRAFSGLSFDQGSALVEFALVITLLLTFIFGIMDLCRAMYTYHFVSNATREATRFAAVRGTSCGTYGQPKPPVPCGALGTVTTCPASAADVQNYVQNCVAPPGITASSLVVTTTWPGTSPPGWTLFQCTNTSGNSSPGCVVQVQVQYPFSFILPFLPKTTTGTCAGASSKFNICMSSISEMVISN